MLHTVYCICRHLRLLPSRLGQPARRYATNVVNEGHHYRPPRMSPRHRRSLSRRGKYHVTPRLNAMRWSEACNGQVGFQALSAGEGKSRARHVRHGLNGRQPVTGHHPPDAGGWRTQCVQSANHPALLRKPEELAVCAQQLFMREQRHRKYVRAAQTHQAKSVAGKQA